MGHAQARNQTRHSGRNRLRFNSGKYSIVLIKHLSPFLQPRSNGVNLAFQFSFEGFLINIKVGLFPYQNFKSSIAFTLTKASSDKNFYCNGCGSVGGDVASDSRGILCESSHRQVLNGTFSVNCKGKRFREWPI